MNKEKGVTMLVALMIVFIVIAVAVLAFLKGDISISPNEKLPYSNEDAVEMAAEPVSTDTKLETIEAEVNDTMVGSPDDDINGMLEEASTLQ